MGPTNSSKKVWQRTQMKTRLIFQINVKLILAEGPKQNDLTFPKTHGQQNEVLNGYWMTSTRIDTFQGTQVKTFWFIVFHFKILKNLKSFFLANWQWAKKNCGTKNLLQFQRSSRQVLLFKIQNDHNPPSSLNFVWTNRASENVVDSSITKAHFCQKKF